MLIVLTGWRRFFLQSIIITPPHKVNYSRYFLALHLDIQYFIFVFEITALDEVLYVYILQLYFLVTCCCFLIQCLYSIFSVQILTHTSLAFWVPSFMLCNNALSAIYSSLLPSKFSFSFLLFYTWWLCFSRLLCSFSRRWEKVIETLILH